MGLRSFLLGRKVSVCTACGEPIQGSKLVAWIWRKEFGTFCCRECVPAIFRRLPEISESPMRIHPGLRDETLLQRAREAGL